MKYLSQKYNGIVKPENEEYGNDFDNNSHSTQYLM
jgi:hypothetical protein